MPRACLIVLVFLMLVATASMAANVQSSFSYTSTITSDDNGPLDLIAELHYDDSMDHAPIAVVMHGYSPSSGNLANVRANAILLRDAGFFTVSVAMRGRDGSDGRRDSGGLEIYDIYDAAEAVKTSFNSNVDPTNVHVTGYSGGGGNVMSALTRFPDYFRAGSSFFGMSDYGYDMTNGWYFNGASSGHRSILNNDVGNPLIGGPTVVDAYHARASNRASHNNPYSEIHLFVNSDETTSPLVNNTSYVDNAHANALFPGEFDNVHVHIGDSTRSTYVDFNGNASNDPNELQYWPHRFPTATQQEAAELWYRDRLLDGSLPEPVLNKSDQLFIPGFVKTRHFEVHLGDGQDTAGTLQYELTTTSKSFSLDVVSSDRLASGWLTADISDMPGPTVNVYLNGHFLEQATTTRQYALDSIRHGDTLLLVVPEPAMILAGLAGLFLLPLFRRQS